VLWVRPLLALFRLSLALLLPAVAVVSALRLCRL
jgi:hypothetical protein